MDVTDKSSRLLSESEWRIGGSPNGGEKRHLHTPPIWRISVAIPQNTFGDWKKWPLCGVRGEWEFRRGAECGEQRCWCVLSRTHVQAEPSRVDVCSLPFPEQLLCGFQQVTSSLVFAAGGQLYESIALLQSTANGLALKLLRPHRITRTSLWSLSWRKGKQWAPWGQRGSRSCMIEEAYPQGRHRFVVWKDPDRSLA